MDLVCACGGREHRGRSGATSDWGAGAMTGIAVGFIAVVGILIIIGISIEGQPRQ
jgi:hypothetical protein